MTQSGLSGLSGLMLPRGANLANPSAKRWSMHHDTVDPNLSGESRLGNFFWEVDRRSGIPTLPRMEIEGKAIPEENKLSRSLNSLAQAVLHAGPPKWTEEEIARARYTITNLCDNTRALRNHAKLTACASSLSQTVRWTAIRRLSAQGTRAGENLGKGTQRVRSRARWPRHCLSGATTSGRLSLCSPHLASV
jgi:hypothetical protein